MPELISEVKVELMELTYTPNGGAATPLGVTKKGSKIVLKASSTKLTVMEFGDTPVNLVGKGWQGDVQLMLAQSSLDKLAIALGSTKTTVAGPPAKYSVDIDPRAAREFPFGKLVLHPSTLGASDVSRDWTIWRAQIEPDLSGDYVADDALVWPLKFCMTLFQNTTTGNVKLATYGDTTTAVDFDANL